MPAYIHMSSREMSAKGNLRTEMSWRVQVIPGQGEVGDVGRVVMQEQSLGFGLSQGL